MNLKRLYFLLIVLSISTIFISAGAQDNKLLEEIPEPVREMRGVWVATVANIDWPSSPTLSVEEQKKEALTIINRVKELKMNAIILQVRPHADALYKSELEPWSYYLTGKQGKAPEPFYDPLEFWIEESHARGIELHAWLNPYRAKHPAMRGEDAPNSILAQKSELVKKLGNRGYYWMDPAIQGVQEHSFKVVMDIVKRYDIDAIHFDDYFYPYWDYNDNKDFPDDDTYQIYKKSGGTMERGDWRRDAVNKFVKRVYDGIKKEKPTVKFGISPFGIFRPGYPKTATVTFDQYDKLYADARLWFNEGWVDYYTPQLYWNITRIPTSYPALLNWWIGENKKQRNLWPGLYIRPEIEKKEMALEIFNQIMITRGMMPENNGTIIFSMRPLIPSESEFNTTLKTGPYTSQALMPPYPWLDNKAPEKPQIKAEKKDSEINISWKAEGKEKPFLYILYIKSDDTWSYEIFSGNSFTTTKKLEKAKITAIAISAVDRCGNESDKSILVIE